MKFVKKAETFSINGEPLITKNNKTVEQDWSKSDMINVILDTAGKIRRPDRFTGYKKTLDFEIYELNKW